MLINNLIRKWKGYNKEYLKFGERTINYCDAISIVQFNSKYLISLGCSEQNISIYIPNSIEYCVALFSVLQARNTAVPLDMKLTNRELLSEVNYTDSTWIICKNTMVDSVTAIFRSSKIGILAINTDFTLHKYATNSCVKERKNNSSVAIMLHTSGTTSEPKKVQLTHKGLFANVKAHIHSLKLKHDDIALVVLPLYFVYANTAQLLAHTYLGGTIIIYDENIFFPKRFCELVQENRVSVFSAVPTLVRLTIMYRYLDRYNLRSLRYFCFGGAPTPVIHVKEAMNVFPWASFIHTYGQTECGPRITALLPKYAMSKIGSIGKPICGVKLRIVDKNDKDVSVGVVGQIIVSGPSIMCGYYKRPEYTKKVIKSNWVYTGDLAKYDADGFIYIVGRSRNMIISSGVNIYPEEIEHEILTFKLAIEAYVFGIPDKIRGEIVAALVVNADGSDMSKQIYEHLRFRIADYKLPAVIRFQASPLVRTVNGKIIRKLNKYSLVN